jgi:hypothetical protein
MLLLKFVAMFADVSKMRFLKILTALGMLCGFLAWQLSAAELVNNAAARRAALDTITVNDLQTHLDFLADDSLEGRGAGTNGGRAAGSYLIQQLQALNVAPGAGNNRYDQPFDGNMRNILGLIPGSDPKLKNEFIIVGAHYDHVGYGNRNNSNGPIGYIHNGADDNASGTAALLELAQALKSLPVAPKRSIIIAFWDGEEINLLGSKHWLRNPTVDLKMLKASINMDMVGRLRQDKLEIYGSRTAPGWRKLVSESNQSDPLRLEYTWVMKADSDHHPFFDAKFPVIMLHTGLHDNYHRPSDDVGTLNIPGIEQISKLLFEITLKLGDELPIGSFRDASKRETPTVRTQRERALPPLGGRLGVRWSDKQSAEPGLEVVEVAARGPAAVAGLKPGDRMLELDGQSIAAGELFRHWILAAPADVTLRVKRPGVEEPVDLPIKLSGDSVRWGLTWREDDAEPGVLFLLRVIDGSPVALAGVKVGDRVMGVNGQRFANQDEFQKLMAADEVVLQLEHEGIFRDVTVRALKYPAKDEKLNKAGNAKEE